MFSRHVLTKDAHAAVLPPTSVEIDSRLTANTTEAWSRTIWRVCDVRTMTTEVMVASKATMRVTVGFIGCSRLVHDYFSWRVP